MGLTGAVAKGKLYKVNFLLCKVFYNRQDMRGRIGIPLQAMRPGSCRFYATRERTRKGGEAL